MKNLSGGMVKNVSRNNQPEGTIRDALNANLNQEQGSVTNEYGNYLVTDSIEFRVLGSVTLDDDRIVAFGINEAENLPSIRIINDKNAQIIRLLETVDLNFKESHPIVATYRKNQAGEVIVYFTDGYRKVEEVEGMLGATYVSEANPPRVINITRQKDWVLGGGTLDKPYGPTNSIDKLSLIPPVGTHSTIDEASIGTGGTIETGAYHLGLAYRDYTGVETNYFVLSNPVYITDGNENVLPTSSLIGAEGGTATNKSIKWTVFCPGEIDYDLLQPVVVSRIDDAEVVYKLTPIKLPAAGGTVYVNFTGLEDATKMNIDDIIIDDIFYTSANTLTQSDNRLYLGNVTTSKDIGYQPFALGITVEPVTEDVVAFDPRVYDTFVLNKGFASLVQKFEKKIGQDYIIEHTNLGNADGWEPVNGSVMSSYQALLQQFMMDGSGSSLKGYKTPKYSFKKKSYRRSEVYAFYISFVLEDGSETYAYHIPGRQAGQLGSITTTPAVYETVYAEAEWVAIELLADDPGDAFDESVSYYITLLYLAPGSDAVQNHGYTAGYYRPEPGWCTFWSHSSDVGYFTDLTSQVSPLQFVSIDSAGSGDCTPLFTSLTDGGTFGSTAHGGSGTNEFYVWLTTHGEALSSPLEFESYVEYAYTGDNPKILETATEELVSEEVIEGGVVNENASLKALPFQDMRTVIGFSPKELLANNQDAKVYQVIDTHRLNQAAGTDMSYWENQNERYPQTLDFINGDVASDGSVLMNTGTNVWNDKVRHHKMPSNFDSNFAYTLPQSLLVPSQRSSCLCSSSRSVRTV
jgi:hypothetical protein